MFHIYSFSLSTNYDIKVLLLKKIKYKIMAENSKCGIIYKM